MDLKYKKEKENGFVIWNWTWNCCEKFVKDME